MTQTPSLKTLQTKIGGMDCGNCAKTVAAGLQKLPGLTEINVVFATESLRLNYDPEQVTEKAIFDRIQTLGYTIEQPSAAVSSKEDCCSGEHHHEHDHEHHHQHSTVQKTQKTNPTNWEFWIRNRRGQSVILAGIGLILGLLTQHLALTIWISRAFYGIGIIVAGYPIARAGLMELRLRRADMNLPVRPPRIAYAPSVNAAVAIAVAPSRTICPT